MKSAYVGILDQLGNSVADVECAGEMWAWAWVFQPLAAHAEKVLLGSGVQLLDLLIVACERFNITVPEG